MTRAAAPPAPRATRSNHGFARAVRRLLMLDAYALVVVGPLALMAGVVKAGAQGRLVIFADALGFAGLSLLALQIVVSGRWAAATRVFGLRSVLGLHRKAGIAVVVLVVAHVVVLFVDDPARLALFDLPPPRARAGVLALVGLLVLAGTSVWRRRLRINYERWRAVHLVCTALVHAAAFAHVVWVDAYTSVPVVRWSVLGIVLAAGVALCWTRVARPYSSALKPCRVLAAGDSCSPPGSASRQPSASCAPPPTPASRARCCCSTAAGTGRT